MLFEKEIREAENKLNKKGFYVCNMVEPNNQQYEVYNGDGEVMIDHLSVAQLIQLANMI